MVILSKIDNFFTEAFKGFGEDFSWSSIVVLLTGVLIGFVLSVCIYLVFFLVSLIMEFM